ncbi:MAG: hypothetical protein R3C49_26335 [Planctomycetaceae bacterium]
MISVVKFRAFPARITPDAVLFVRMPVAATDVSQGSVVPVCELRQNLPIDCFFQNSMLILPSPDFSSHPLIQIARRKILHGDWLVEIHRRGKTTSPLKFGPGFAAVSIPVRRHFAGRTPKKNQRDGGESAGVLVASGSDAWTMKSNI